MIDPMSMVAETQFTVDVRTLPLISKLLVVSFFNTSEMSG